jgi:hypothetical protein
MKEETGAQTDTKSLSFSGSELWLTGHTDHYNHIDILSFNAIK